MTENLVVVESWVESVSGNLSMMMSHLNMRFLSHLILYDMSAT
jgi:hypothetical protein